MPGPVALEVRYAPGDGVLVGGGSRWLLLDVDEADDGWLESLWDLVTAPGAGWDDRVLAAVEGRYAASCSLVLVDLTPGAETATSRGAGRVVRADGRRLLRLGDGDPSCGRRLVSGVVGAAAADLVPVAAREQPPAPVVPPAAPPPPTAGLIDGIPPEILAASAPEPTPRLQATMTTDEPTIPPAARPPAPGPGSTRRRGEPLTHTTYRPDRAGRLDEDAVAADDGPPTASGPGPARVDHLRQSTHETVLAVHCPAGHATPALTGDCRVCGLPVPPQEPQRVPRPRLGFLHLPDGTRVPLDRGVVFGRQPSAPPTGEDWPHLVRLPSDTTYVSRNHLQVELDGWLVLAVDLGSRGGTTLRVPGRPPERIRSGERYIWEPGQVFDLADSYEILYEVSEDVRS